MANTRRAFVTLGMFIIDEFCYADEDGEPTGKTSEPQIGGGGTYASMGGRIWLPPHRLGMIIDRGHDFPSKIQHELEKYGSDMWLFRDQPESQTTRALNSYRGDYRGFEYLTPRIRITPRDLEGTKLAQPTMLHFICSPSRASDIMSEVDNISNWSPTTIYEPIPDRCIPEELPALVKVLPSISILSPNAEEALSLLSYSSPPGKESVELAAKQFLELGVKDSVIIRSGPLGAYVTTREKGGKWIKAYWDKSEHPEKVIDVTGAGNGFLGGLAAGLEIAGYDVYEATFYATVSASYIIEQEGLPVMSATGWNEDSPSTRLELLKKRH